MLANVRTISNSSASTLFGFSPIWEKYSNSFPSTKPWKQQRTCIFWHSYEDVWDNGITLTDVATLGKFLVIKGPNRSWIKVKKDTNWLMNHCNKKTSAWPNCILIGWFCLWILRRLILEVEKNQKWSIWDTFCNVPQRKAHEVQKILNRFKYKRNDYFRLWGSKRVKNMFICQSQGEK